MIRNNIENIEKKGKMPILLHKKGEKNAKTNMIKWGHKTANIFMKIYIFYVKQIWHFKKAKTT